MRQEYWKKAQLPSKLVLWTLGLTCPLGSIFNSGLVTRQIMSLSSKWLTSAYGIFGIYNVCLVQWKIALTIFNFRDDHITVIFIFPLNLNYIAQWNDLLCSRVQVTELPRITSKVKPPWGSWKQHLQVLWTWMGSLLRSNSLKKGLVIHIFGLSYKDSETVL